MGKKFLRTESVILITFPSFVESNTGVPAAYPSNKVQAYSYNQTSIMYIVTEVERP